MNKLFILLSIIILMLLTSSDGFAQTSKDAALTQLPSDVYYQDNISPPLRAGEPGEPGGPGGPPGGGEGGNEWVGAPIGEGLLCILFAGVAYGVVLSIRKKKKQVKVTTY